MEWLLVNPHLHNIFASLGSQVGDQYVAHPNCRVTLDHIMTRLCKEDRTLRTFRRAIGFSNLIKKDLLQLLIAIKNDRVIIDKTIKLFAELTTPVEKLIPVDVMSRTDAGRTTVLELNWLLFSAKESFLDPKATNRILEHMKIILSEGSGDGIKHEDTLNDCVSLLRNILHVPESRPTSKGTAPSHQNCLLWNLFSHSFDKLLINLATRPQSGEWKVGTVQLIILLYKDQQETMLLKLLHHWLHATAHSESSEDNESNTSPPDNYSRSSEPTSDSSDNSISDMNVDPEEIMPLQSSKKMQNTGRKQFVHIQTKKSEIHERDTAKYNIARRSDERGSITSMDAADSGCHTMEDNHESVSSSSNDESPERTKPIHVKPLNMIHKQRVPKQNLSPEEKREIKIKKLRRRAMNNSSLKEGSMLYALSKNLVHHHVPTNDDISHILKEFTIDFLLSGYSCLIEDQRRQIIESRENSIDTSQFFWLVTYFLKFAVSLELDFECIRPVLSRDVLNFLVYQAVCLCEQYESSWMHSDFDNSSRLHRLHLALTAIREVLLTMNAYFKAPFVTTESKQILSQFQSDVCEMEDLRNLFVLMFRQYNPEVHCRPYLIDLICTNHILIDTIDKCPTTKNSTLVQNHLNQFTTPDVMKLYGELLGNFEENGPIVNDCIFTMMHHVAGDMGCLSSLFQPCIIKVFTQIYECGMKLMDDWSDLIEFVIHQFMMSTKSRKTSISPPNVLGEIRTHGVNEEWSKEDCDTLYWYFIQSTNSSDPMGSIIQLYIDSGVQNKTRIGLIEQLLKQDIISDTHFNELMAKESIVPVIEKIDTKKEIEHLKKKLLTDGMAPIIMWLQKEVLKACHAKMSLDQETEGILEATPTYYLLRDETIPIVPWSREQYTAMQSHDFLLLLHKLGFLLPADTGHSFARIPKTWSIEKMYNLVTMLGPLPENWVRFDLTSVQQENMDVE